MLAHRRSRHVIRTIALPLSALALLAAACGRVTGSGGSGGGGIEHPTGADELVLRMDVGGGFVAPTYELARIPTWSLFGDGRVITEGPQAMIYPGPALPNVQVQTITEDGIQAILEQARQAGLMGPDRDYAFHCITDAPTTTFTIYADGQKHVITAYALGESQGPCQGADTAARAKLAAFQAELSDLARWLPAGSIGQQGRFEPSEMRVYVQPYSGASGQDLHQDAIDWPLAQQLSAFGQPDPSLQDLRCGVVAGSDLLALLTDAERANQLTPWRDGGARYSLIFRPLLPDEHSC
jgi:hypothetical protein